MAVFRFWPALAVWAFAFLMGVLSRRGRFAGGFACCCVLCAGALILLILMEGGALLEGLACLLPLLFLILPKEKRHEL